MRALGNRNLALYWSERDRRFPFLITVETGVSIPPTLANGKVCYIEMPATDIQRSATF